MRAALVSIFLLGFVRIVIAWPLAQEPVSIDKNWTLHEQDDRVCKAGSRTFAGRVNVTEGKSIFFWLVESRRDPGDHPVLIWLNGGPGASSMIGLFAEIGPCLLDDDDTSTSFNPDSWSNSANLLFIDQPASVGFSTVDDESLIPGELETASADFSAFLSIFFVSLFPQPASNPVFVAGESHGGRYVPRPNSHNFAGIAFVDVLVSVKYLTTGQYDLFCMDGPSSPYFTFNEPVCNAMAVATPECEKLSELCEVTRDPYSCKAADRYCADGVGRYFTEEYMSGQKSPYDLRKSCPKLPLCGTTNPYGGSLNTYLNKSEIQKLLGLPSPVNYSDTKYDLAAKWEQNPIVTLPSTPEVVYLLDTEGLDVLVLEGQFDVAVNPPGTIRFYDNLGWHGLAGYRNRQFDGWYWKDRAGQIRLAGTRKGVGKLQLFTVNDAGHMSPGDQKGAVASVFGRWLDGIQTKG